MYSHKVKAPQTIPNRKVTLSWSTGWSCLK